MAPDPARKPDETREEEYFRRIGRRGGDTTKRTYGLQYYVEMGRKGGEALKEKRGTEYYRALGQKGALARHGRETRGGKRGNVGDLSY